MLTQPSKPNKLLNRTAEWRKLVRCGVCGFGGIFILFVCKEDSRIVMA